MTIMANLHTRVMWTDSRTRDLTTTTPEEVEVTYLKKRTKTTHLLLWMMDVGDFNYNFGCRIPANIAQHLPAPLTGPYIQLDSQDKDDSSDYCEGQVCHELETTNLEPDHADPEEHDDGKTEDTGVHEDGMYDDYDVFYGHG